MSLQYVMFVSLLSFFNLATANTLKSHLGQPSGLVDLGYAQHIPTYVNTTKSGQRISIYQNIRFGNPPVGDLRFRKPNTTLPVIQGIQDGRVPWGSRDCIATAPPYLPYPEINGTWGHEDCLFLDVYVPESVKHGDQVPVLHFFFGGAYAFGSKETLFHPLGIFDRILEEGKFIFVVNNYRLGVSGWTYADGLDMDANVGLYDCLAAVQWTAKYIDRFGGDVNKVTAAGQSAGAGILYYMSVLLGGKEKLPFQQMFLSSPAVPPRRDIKVRQRQLFDIVLNTANCTSVECLRHLTEEDMKTVNDQLINGPATGGGGNLGPVIGFGPAPDGNDIPDLPLALLGKGRYHKELRGLMLGSMSNEGMGLSNDTDMPASFGALVRQIMPSASNATIATIQAQYNPLEPSQLAWDWTTDAIFACNDYNLANAFSEVSKRYIMSIPPAIHGQDVYYYFYNDQETTPVENVTQAIELQSKLLKFIHHKEVEWPNYSRNRLLFNITSGGYKLTSLKSDLKARCDVLNSAVLDPANGV